MFVIQNNDWLTVNDDFVLVTSDAIPHRFSIMAASLGKIIGESFHKIVIHGKPYIILFLTLYLCTEHTELKKTSNDRSILRILEKIDSAITAPHCISYTSVMPLIRPRIAKHIHCVLCDIIIHSWPNFNGCVAAQPLKLEWVRINK